jgi:hypothetical protein
MTNTNKLEPIKFNITSSDTRSFLEVEPAYREIAQGVRDEVARIFSDPNKNGFACCVQGCCVSHCCVQLS